MVVFGGNIFMVFIANNLPKLEKITKLVAEY